MDYYDSAEDLKISQDRAFQELQNHGLSGEWDDFIKHMGDKETYNAQAVLRWLGY